MTAPTPRLLRLLALALVAAALPAVVGPSLWPVWLVLTAALVTLGGVDAILVGARRPRTAVHAPSALGVQSGGQLTVTVRPAAGEALPPCEVRCDRDPLLRPAVMGPLEPVAGEVGAWRVAFPLRPRRRGQARPGPLWLRWSGPLGLMRRAEAQPLDLEIAILPELCLGADRALRALGADHRQGLLVERFTGEGSEFHQLREYVPGLDHRRLDWKASARHRQLLVRQQRAERDQQVIVAVDCGRLLGVVDQGLPRLDHALDAALRLALLSLRQGDRVGLFGFAAGPRLWLPPRGGLAHFARVQQHAAQLHAVAEETNFTLALAELAGRLTRRALVVVLTDFADAISAELMRDNLRRLARRHLVLLCALREESLDRVARAAPRSEALLARTVVAEDLRQERRTVLQALQRAGVQTIDAVPRTLTADLLDRYLEIKRREMIA